MKKNFKIRIFQPVVQEYRVALHEGLADRYGDRIEIWASPRRGVDVSVPLKKMRYDYSHKFFKFGPFIWQTGFSLKGLSKGDVIVVCGDIHQLSSLWIAISARLKGVKVVWWGHHKSASPNELNVKIRLWIAKCLSDIMLCYTDAGIKYLVERGFDISCVFATGNTIDLQAVETAVKKWNGERKYGNRKTLLFCGVLRQKVRVDVLLNSLKLLKNKGVDVHCALIGTGEKEVEWKRLSQELGLSDMVTWVGELRGQDNLAPWFLSSDLFVYPGSIGLSIIHAFSYGLPVVLNNNINNHGPEYEAFHPGENGWAFEENNPIDLAEKIESALADSQLRKRGEEGKMFVCKNYSMSRMVERTVEAIENAAKI